MICSHLTQAKQRWSHKEKGTVGGKTYRSLTHRLCSFFEMVGLHIKISCARNGKPPVFSTVANCEALDRLTQHCLSADDPLKLLATIRASLIAIPLCNYTMSCDKRKE